MMWEVKFLKDTLIKTEFDIVTVRKIVKELTSELKFRVTAQTKLITAASEIARNTLKYGGGGKLILSIIEEGTHKGLQLSFEDEGQGIVDIEQALQDGYTTGNGLGLGLGGTKRLVSKFKIISEVGKGTSVTIASWSNQ